MNPWIKERWLGALRSGDFKQIDGYLGVVGENRESEVKGFCCLGVLCELAVDDGIIERTLAADEDFFHYDYATGDLPLKVQQWAGLDSGNPEVSANHVHAEECGGNAEIGYQCDFSEDDEDTTYPLSALNDDHKWNFEQIADAIERGL